LHNRKRKQVQLSWYLHLSSTFALAWFLGGGDTMFDVTMFVEFPRPPYYIIRPPFCIHLSTVS